MKRYFTLFLTYLFLTAANAQNEVHAGLIFLGARGVSSNIGPTNLGGSNDRYKMFRPTFLTFLVIGQSDSKAMYWNIRGINFLYYVIKAKDPKRYNEVSIPSQRLTYNYNRTATDFSIFTTDFFYYFGEKRVRYGIGGSYQWNAEGVYLNDANYASSTIDPIGKFGGTGLGSGVYKLRYRSYLGLGAGIKTASKDGKLQLALNGTFGPYTTGSMRVLEAVSSFAFTEKVGFQLTLARRVKNFKEYENLPSVNVKTNDLNFGIWFHLK